MILRTNGKWRIMIAIRAAPNSDFKVFGRITNNCNRIRIEYKQLLLLKYTGGET